MGKLDEIYHFSEKRFTAYNHSLRIFVHGTDVSEWVKGAVTVTYNGTDSYNTASFDLSNPRRIFQITEENLCPPNKNCTEPPKMRLGGDEYSESAKSSMFYYKQNVNEKYHNVYFNTLNSGLVVDSASLGEVKKNSVQGANPFSFNKFFPPKQYEEARYRLYISDCIFNKNDYVRIFKKNPFKGDADQWVEIFCGFIQEHPVTTNYITGESTVRISCSCIKQQMQKMRVNINVHLANLDPQQLIEQGFYRDFANPSEMTHPFAVSNLENTIKTLVLGSATPSRDPAKMSQDEIKRKVGEFKLGNVVCYNPSSPGNILERWHLMTVFGVNKVPFPEGGNKDDLWLTTEEMIRIGKATRASQGANDEVAGPAARYLHMLLPASGTGPSSLIQYSLIQAGNAADRREWSSRWEIIREFASKLDFQVLTSPSGDILLEFPQYGFTPCAYLTNFNSEPVEKEDSSAEAAVKSKSSPLTGSSTGKDKGSKKAFQQCHVGKPDGHYESGVANIFIYKLHIKEETLNDEAEDFPTILQISGGFAFQGGPTPKAQNEVLNPRGYIFSPVLVARYGAITNQVDFPFAGQRKDEFGGTEAAFTKRLAKLGLIEYVRRMADASTWQGSLVYRPFQFPNRPVHLRRCHRMGLTTSVSYTYNVGQNVSMTLNCRMLMARRHDGTYRLQTGSVNTPVDYGAIWGEDEVGTKDGGVISVITTLYNKDKDKKGEGGSGDVGSPTTPTKGKPPNEPDLEKASKATFGAQKVPSLSTLMPEFRVIMQRLYEASREVDPENPLMISPAGETVDRSIGKTVKGKKGFGLHPIGLAVDTYPFNVGDISKTSAIKESRNDQVRQYYVKIIAKYKEKHGSSYEIPEWGGSTPTYEAGHLDNVHFQAPRSWGNMAGFANALVAQNPELAKGDKSELKQKVWDKVRATRPQIATLLGKNPDDVPKEILSKLGQDTSGSQEELLARARKVTGVTNADLGAVNLAIRDPGGLTGDAADPTQAPPPAPCGDTDLLTVPGLRKL